MNILILSYSNLDSDPRILRQIEALSDHAKIYTAGYSSASRNFVHHRLIRHDRFHSHYPLLLRKLISLFYLHIRDFLLLIFFKHYYSYYWNFFRRRSYQLLRSQEKYDLIIANDIDTLPLALKIAKNSDSPVWYDAHEYSPLENSEDGYWMRVYAPAITAWCKKFIPKATLCTTVSSGLVSEYKKLTGVDFELVLNAPSFQQHKTRTTNYPIKFIHHGGAMKARHPELMIQVFAQLPPEKYELHLMLTLNQEPYYDELVQMAKPFKHIHFHKPVPTLDICATINQYDVGLFLLPPVNFNYEFALPNKFFEFLQARLMILIGPSIEMKKIVEEYDLGIVTPSIEIKDIVAIIHSITPDQVDKFKKNVDQSAMNLSGDLSVKKIQELFKRCLYVWDRRNH